MTRAPGAPAVLARVAVAVARVLILLPPPTLIRVVTLALRDAREPDVDTVATARAAVCAVSRRCAGQGCLQRSVAVVLLCRIRGVAPDWCTGFVTEPFIAHAWVEVSGTPVSEDPRLAGYIMMHEVRRRPDHTHDREAAA